MSIHKNLIGQYVIARCRNAGVHFGKLEAVEDSSCVLNESRRLWYWACKKEAFLSGLARHGIASSSKVGGPITAHLSEWCELIPVAPDAIESFREIETYEQG